jgi:hypothetical protein
MPAWASRSQCDTGDGCSGDRRAPRTTRGNSAGLATRAGDAAAADDYGHAERPKGTEDRGKALDGADCHRARIVNAHVAREAVAPEVGGDADHEHAGGARGLDSSGCSSMTTHVDVDRLTMEPDDSQLDFW